MSDLVGNPEARFSRVEACMFSVMSDKAYVSDYYYCSRTQHSRGMSRTCGAISIGRCIATGNELYEFVFIRQNIYSSALHYLWCRKLVVG